MGAIGSIILIVMLVLFLYTASGLANFSKGLFNGQFRVKGFLIFIYGTIVLVVIFYLSSHFSDELGIKTTCPRAAPNCQT